MIKMKIPIETVNYALDNHAKGCQLCVQGRKLVLFATGVCHYKCPYCPISEKKRFKDVAFANERKISSDEGLIEEIIINGATGAGITGGDPLARTEKTVHYIRLMKKKFGNGFHCHLYTPLDLVNEKNLKILYDAGLDEIRFHPYIHEDKLWPRISLALKYNWDIGVEIPVIPGKKEETIKLIEFIKDKASFLNLNELEISETNAGGLVPEGFLPKSDISYGVKGSQELAKELADYAGQHTNLSVHYCSAKLKDRIQLGNRLMNRGKNIAKDYDILTGEGTIIRGALYLKNLAPGFSYRNALENADRTKILENLEKLKEKFRNEKIAVDIDCVKLRLTTSLKSIEKNKTRFKKLNLLPAIVEEYPTYDAVEIDVTLL